MVDLTHAVKRFRCRFGTRTGHAMGYVAVPGNGILTLENEEDPVYYPYGNPPYDPVPGARLWVEHRNDVSQPWELKWVGWLVQPGVADDVHTPSEVVLEYTGALGQIVAAYYDLYLTLGGGDLLTGEVLRRVLDNVGWPFGRRIDEGQTRINSWFANQANVFRRLSPDQSDADTVPILDALDVVAQAEFGRIFDDHQGSIAFHDRYRRAEAYGSRFDGLVTHTIDPADIPEPLMGPFGSNVVNDVTAEGSKWLLQEDNNVVFEEFDLTIPPLYDNGHPGVASHIIPVGSINQDQRADQPEIIQTHPRDIPDGIVLNAWPTPEGDVRIEGVSSLDESVTIRIIRVTANIWRSVEGTAGRLANRYSRASISRYGRRQYSFPASIIDQDSYGEGSADGQNGDVLDALDWILATHDGLNPELIQTCDLRMSPLRFPPVMDISVGDIIFVTGPILGIPGHSYWFVDEIEYDVLEGTGHRFATLRCSTARPWGHFISGRTGIDDARVSF